MTTAVRCRLAGAALALTMATGTAACFGDPEPDPSVAPIEIVANSRAEPESPCLVNRPSVGAGTHELVVIAESAPAVVRVQDADGVQLYEERVEQGASTSTTIVLEAGRYSVSCAQDGRTPVTTIGLQVDDD